PSQGGPPNWHFPTRIPPPSVEEAEAEAAIWLGEYAYTGQPPVMFEGVEGTETHTCVDVAGLERVRSGDFVLDLSRWAAPAHAFELTPVLEEHAHLLLRATQVVDGGEPATHVHEYDGRGALARTGRLTPTFVLPRTGAWLVVAVAGPQW